MASAGGKDVDEWVKLFNSADTDKSGALDQKELSQLLKKGGSNLSDSQVKQIFEFFDDANGDKKITKEEFCAGLQKIKNRILELVSAFKAADKDKSGFLDRPELKKLILDNVPGVTEPEINQVVEVIDANKDGKISCQEFISAFF